MQDLSRKENIKVLRGSLLHFLSDPGNDAQASSYEYIEDGLLVLADGLVQSIGEYSDLIKGLPAKTKIEDHSGYLIMPGFIDSHVHYVQTDIIASYGGQLLDWLEKYAFPAERRFENFDHSKEVAEFFLDEMLRNGTTSALVMGSVHKHSAEAVFSAAQAKKMRLMAGKVLMDRNCPEYLQDTPESGYQDSKSLIDRWHGNDRLLYAVTPRFAPTSSPEQLTMVGRLLEEYPDVFMHTHVAESREEVTWVSDLFPQSRSYLDVYDNYGLLRERAVLAHCIHLDHDDHVRMAQAGAAAAFCPTSNLFLGSGFFDLNAADEAGFRVGMATDVGGGTSFNMLQTLSEAYKVLQVTGQSLNPLRAFYLATLGSARALYIDEHVGNFAKGMEADFIVLDLAATPILQRRTDSARDIEEKLFALMMLGDDRAIRASYLMGEIAHSR